VAVQSMKHLLQNTLGEVHFTCGRSTHGGRHFHTRGVTVTL
jgi:hypothetical protein